MQPHSMKVGVLCGRLAGAVSFARACWLTVSVTAEDVIEATRSVKEC